MRAKPPSADAGLWVFGYGSLIWDPGFPYTHREIAWIEGYRRSFCMRSIHHRGTEADPGLVLALDAHDGSRCDGVAFAVAEREAAETLEALRARELISSAYIERWLPVYLQGGGAVSAVAYVVDPAHGQYCGDLALETQAQIIARARGGRGRNRDYLFSTAEHLRELGLDDPELDWLAARVQSLPGN